MPSVVKVHILEVFFQHSVYMCFKELRWNPGTELHQKYFNMFTSNYNNIVVLKMRILSCQGNKDHALLPRYYADFMLWTHWAGKNMTVLLEKIVIKLLRRVLVSTLLFWSMHGTHVWDFLLFQFLYACPRLACHNLNHGCCLIFPTNILLYTHVRIHSHQHLFLSVNGYKHMHWKCKRKLQFNPATTHTHN